MPIVSPTMFTNICICVSITLTVFFTENPLAVMALFFLQPEPSHQFLTGDDTNAVSDEEVESDYGGSSIGFLSDVK